MTEVVQYTINRQRDWDVSELPLNYAQNTQEHRNSNNFPYNLVLICLLPEPSPLLADSDWLRPSKPEASQQQMRAMLQAHDFELRNKTNTHLRRSEARYWHDYDRRAREKPAFQTGEYVFLRKPLLSNLSYF